MEMRIFDIVIAGGGTPGCVLTACLSAHPSLQVLLLEAVADRNNDRKVLIPLTSRRMFRNPDYDWHFTSTPQEHLHGHVFEHTRGRMLGGSSAINSRSLAYRNRAIHEAWASISGDERWSWQNMKQYYHKFTDAGDGPIQASYLAKLDRLQKGQVDIRCRRTLRLQGNPSM